MLKQHFCQILVPSLVIGRGKKHGHYFLGNLRMFNICTLFLISRAQKSQYMVTGFQIIMLLVIQFRNLYFCQRLLNSVAIIININNSFVTLALN